LLSFTGHFLQQSARQKVILAAMVLEEDHTGVYLASKLTEAMQLWHLNGKIHMGIRDNAANMICAMQRKLTTSAAWPTHCNWCYTTLCFAKQQWRSS